MGAQENVADPTEQWETGSPTAQAEELRMDRFKNARTQMTSSFPPIKRLTLERKSPVTRLDVNAPSFDHIRRLILVFLRLLNRLSLSRYLCVKKDSSGTPALIPNYFFLTVFFNWFFTQFLL